MENKSGVLRRAVSSKAFWMAFAFALFLWLNNTSLFTDRSGQEPVLVAHRALENERVQIVAHSTGRMHMRYPHATLAIEASPRGAD